MQAIRTRILGPTNTKGTRVKAQITNGASVTLPFDSGLNSSDNHRNACHVLQTKLNWLTVSELMIGGTFKDDMYWVFNI